jgi:hypothetical protein
MSEHRATHLPLGMRGLAMTPLLGLADAELAQLIATAALLPAEKRAAFVQRVVAALAAGETSVLRAIAVAQRSYLKRSPEGRDRYPYGFRPGNSAHGSPA